MSGALTKDPKTGIVSYDENEMWLLFYVRYELPVRVLKADTATRTKS